MTGTHSGAAAARIVKSAVTMALAAFAVAGAVGMTGQAAHAQAVPDAARKPYAVKLGAFIPTNITTRQAGSTLNLYLEADATIQRQPELRSVSVFSIGYVEHDNFRMMPLTIGQIFRDPGNSSGKDYYYGLGIGIYPTRIQGFGTSGQNKNLLGGYGVIGMEITPRIFAEAKYHYISKYDSKFVGGLIFAVGTRF